MSVTVRCLGHASTVDMLHVPLCITLEPFAQRRNHLCQPVMGHQSDPTGIKDHTVTDQYQFSPCKVMFPTVYTTA